MPSGGDISSPFSPQTPETPVVLPEAGSESLDVQLAQARDELARLRPIAQRNAEIGEHAVRVAVQNEKLELENRMLVEELEKRDRLEKFLLERARLDPLTNIANRQHFFEDAESRDLHGQPFALGVLDLDKFKAVNDEKGHLFGDDLLKMVVGAIIEILQADIRQHDDLVARLGGDEFGLLIDLSPRRNADISPEERMHAVAAKILARIKSQSIEHGLDLLNFAASIGFAIHKSGTGVTQTYQLADKRMYEYKRAQKEQQAKGL